MSPGLAIHALVESRNRRLTDVFSAQGTNLTRSSQDLDTILNVAINRRTVRPPADLADQEWIGRILVEIGPFYWTALGGDHSQADLRVCLAGPRVMGLLDRPWIGRIIQDRVERHAVIVELHESELLRVGAPPVRRPAAVEDFLVVHPVGVRMPQVVAPAGRQASLGLRGDVDHEQVVITHEGNSLAVRAELGPLFATSRSRQTDRRKTVKRRVIKVRSFLEQESSFAWVHVEGGPASD